jgi:PAS domain S-box-containing protein
MEAMNERTPWSRIPGEMAQRIHAFDWSRTPLGSIETWTERCHSVVDMALASGFPTIALVGPELIQIYNDSYRDLMGEKHPAGLGQPSLECWPEAAHIDAPIYKRVFAGETVTLQDSHRRLMRHGAVEDAWFTLSYSPLRGMDGTVADVLVVVFETTDRLRAQNALQASEARFRAFVNASADVVYRMGPDWTELRELDGRGFLSNTDEPSRNWLDRYIHPEDQPTLRVAIDRAIGTKSTFALEHRVIRTDGSLGWAASRAVPVLDDEGEIVEWLGAASDVTVRERARQAERAGRERQAFLLKLSDALRRLSEAAAIQGEACRLLAEQLGADRAYYVEVDEAAGIARVERDHVRNGAPSLVGEHPVSSFAWSVDILRRGECHVISDTQSSPLVPDTERAACAALGIVGCMGAPLIKVGRLVGALCVTVAEVRDWQSEEVDLLRDVGERIWATVERAQAEARLRASEALFRSFAENSTDTLWIVDATTGRLDYLSPAFAAMFGADPDGVMADIGRFLDLVHPDDRTLVAGAMPTLLSSGDTYQVEYRIKRPGDGAVRWLQDTGFPIRDASGTIERAGGVVQDVTDRREAEETLRGSEKQLQVMVAELHHRTRNLIGIVGTLMRQIIASSTSLSDFRTRFTERLEALSRVQGLFSAKADDRIDVGDIVRLELDALGTDLVSDRIAVEGEPIGLRKSTVQTLALAIHELATNARKYGALHAGRGRLSVRWEKYGTDAGKWRLRFEWTETGIEPRVEEAAGSLHKGGYGRKLIEEALPYTLKATTTYALGGDRLDCTIDMPLDR